MILTDVLGNHKVRDDLSFIPRFVQVRAPHTSRTRCFILVGRESYETFREYGSTLEPFSKTPPCCAGRHESVDPDLKLH